MNSNDQETEITTANTTILTLNHLVYHHWEPDDDPRHFNVSKFCSSYEISRQFYYLVISPRLHEVNKIRSEEFNYRPIPEPKTTDHRRHLKNQERFWDDYFKPEKHYKPFKFINSISVQALASWHPDSQQPGTGKGK